MLSHTPPSVNSVLWSYNLNEINVQKDKKIIISQVLNFGSEEAIKWLFKQYGFATVEQVANTIPLFQWNKKSLSLWKTILSINPKKRIS
ncbi:hypothetical protein AUK04_00370 [Candidatus Roizmanbacteria bacterium CG2_30_33_16]|uniref:DUF6922 domain-containing protein n=5 Tax=Candidatus Roizmaniibacteriota TaxID=1752723 RepID=A0A2M7E3Q3_9BACT|nr:hypothetical protein [Candidatus Roizmanbacteria bacterium]OIP86588.1 MAG: hypothetical protein AUK04_00370 [Candidatus Roizmanbacteria bacterium CG2_30_33_16]PIP14857.1 MAG: hypothetical protein COX47_02855 [Candidatus Roizmanbacteria bacterium CG23_combo_of_CG06-09_8_20_14_all_35_49]PIV62342.1 MAG: hypothetical protein COS12_02740 [Candidatus Roizmanbacteria bacterium CG01_land_8_20_14_3_00_33_9]PJB88224.1 MAG: hypothetical protein CO083_02780 [Candidatus Roizmanbacteria bacterium CG_4_9_1